MKYCRDHGILVTAYSPLGNNLAGLQKLVDYPEVKEIADRLGATPAQVLIAWGAYDEGVSVIPKSVQEGTCNSAIRLPLATRLPSQTDVNLLLCRPNHLELQTSRTHERGLRRYHVHRQGPPL